MRYSKGISAVARSFRGVSILSGLWSRRGSYVDKKLHKVGVHSHCEIYMLMRLEGGWRANEGLENRLSSIESPAINGGVYTCCACKHVDVAIPFKLWKEKQK